MATKGTHDLNVSSIKSSKVGSGVESKFYPRNIRPLNSPFSRPDLFREDEDTHPD